MPRDPLMAEAAGLIREHLWLGRGPPRSPDGRPWTMGRELSIWKILCKGWKPEEVNGAISVVRKLRPDWAGEPLKMTVFYWKTKEGFNSTPFLEGAVAYWYRENERAFRPATLAEILRGSAQGG